MKFPTPSAPSAPEPPPPRLDMNAYGEWVMANARRQNPEHIRKQKSLQKNIKHTFTLSVPAEP